MSSEFISNAVTDHGIRKPRSGRRIIRHSSKASQVVSRQKLCNKNKENLKIGTWNVSILLRAGKLEQLKKDKKKAEIEILELSETRLKDKDDFISD